PHSPPPPLLPYTTLFRSLRKQRQRGPVAGPVHHWRPHDEKALGLEHAENVFARPLARCIIGQSRFARRQARYMSETFNPGRDRRLGQILSATGVDGEELGTIGRCDSTREMDDGGSA